MWVPSSSGITLSSLTPQNQQAFDAATNRLTGGTNVYDSAGDQAMDAQGRRFTYDAENRQVSFNESVGRYYYDGDGRRVKKIDGNGTTIFVYNAGGQLIAEYTSGTPTAGDTSYLTTDHLGSTRVVTDSGGNVKARYDYLPFGEEIGQVGGRSGTLGYGAADNTRQKFTQKERDSESGLDYFLARYYSSVQGRFTSPDEFTGGPVELYKFVDTASANPTFYSDIFEPQSLNKYHYALNNPLRYVDRDGHQAQAEALRIGAAAAAGSRAGPAGAAGAVAGYLLYDNRKEIVEAIDHNERAKAELGQLFYEAVKNLYKKITGQQENQQEQPQQAQQQGEPQGQQGYSDEDLARMKQGRPPIGKDGNPKELHHPDQDTKKPVQPMTRTEHRGAGNSKQNHPVGNQRTSKIDRKKFKKERREYWRNEAKKEEERRRQSQ
jgi:RHS repeat-associated protein